MIRRLLLAMAVLIPAAMAQDVGMDFLGLQHPRFPVARTAELLPDGFVGGHLDWTFGASLANVERLLETGHIKRWRVHIFNGPGLRNRQLGRYEPHFGYSITSFSKAWERTDAGLARHLRSRARLYCRLFARFPGTTLQISPTLESNLTHRAFRAQARVVHRGCPMAQVVENPVAGVSSARGFTLERHGIKAMVSSPCIVSLDGDSVEDIRPSELSAFLAEFRKCETAYLWSRTFNGRLATGDFIDPRARKAWPTDSDLETLFALHAGAMAR